MSELPKGWESVNLIDFIYSVPTGVPKFAGKRKYYSTGSINGNNHMPEDEYSFDKRPSRANRIAKESDVFQARMQGTDKALLINEAIADQLFSTGFLQFRPIAKTYNGKLLFYFVKSDFFLKQRDELATGSTQIALTDTNAVNLKLIVPPVKEQRRIVNKLEKLLHRVDACKERLNKIPAILKRFRQSVLAAACSGRLTADWREKNLCAPSISTSIEIPFEVPDTWRWINLYETGDMRRGKSKHRPRDAAFLYGGNYPFIQTGDIAQSGGRIVSHKQTYSEAGLAQSKLWPKGTICITIAANIAESSILTYPACFPDSVVGIIANDKICTPEYVEYFIRVAKSDLSAFAPATAQKNINVAILSEVKVPLPPLSEQHEIVRRVEALLKKADEIEARYKKAKAFVDKLTQSILAKAFRGELVPQDRNDEPASALLELIKKKKYELEKAKKAKKQV